MSRIIVIIWRWKSHVDVGKETIISPLLKDNYKFEIEVNNKNDFIHGYTKENLYYEKKDNGEYENIAKGKQYDVNDIKKEAKNLSTDNQILILCHRGSPDNLNKEKFMSGGGLGENIMVADFGGGKGPIYEHLLGGSDFKESAIVSDEDGNIFVKKEAFDEVWKLYFLMELKKKIYELKEDLLITLYPHSFNCEKFKLADSLQLKRDNISLKDRINNFIKDGDLSDDNFKFDEFRKTLNEDKYNEKYEVLKDKLSELKKKKSISITTEYVTALNHDFNNLISSFEGIPIY